MLINKDQREWDEDQSEERFRGSRLLMTRSHVGS